jgi:hypothetical protein
VAAHPQSHPEEQILREGQQVLIRNDGLGAVAALTPGADAWTRGMLVVDNARLEDLVQLAATAAGIWAWRRKSPTCASPAASRCTTPTGAERPAADPAGADRAAHAVVGHGRQSRYKARFIWCRAAAIAGKPAPTEIDGAICELR